MKTLVMEERITKTTPCICGDIMYYKEGTVTRNVKDQVIRVHKVPLHECPTCGDRAFDITTDITSVIVNAYRAGTNDVFYNRERK